MDERSIKWTNEHTGLNEAVVATALMLRSFHFDFDRAPPLKFKYDLTLNLEGSCTATVTPRPGP